MAKESLEESIATEKAHLSSDPKYAALREFFNRYEDEVPTTVEWVNANYETFKGMQTELLTYETPIFDPERALHSTD